MAEQSISTAANKALVEVTNLSFATAENRILFNDLNLSLSEERVAVIGRNGVGKSTLLRLLVGDLSPDTGSATLSSEPYVVYQTLEPTSEDTKMVLDWFTNQPFPAQLLQKELTVAGLRPLSDILRNNSVSHGELRKLKLLKGKLTRPSLMFLDEPTQDLDEAGISWLRSWMRDWSGALLVVSHESVLLDQFENFFIVAESGCRSFSGSFAELESELEREHSLKELRYLQNLNRLAEREEHTLQIARRRARKKRYGRISELRRATPRKTLNRKRDYAEFKHGRMKKLRDTRLRAMRDWAKSTRSSLHINLPLELAMPNLPAETKEDLILLQNVSASAGNRSLFENINLSIGRQRLALVGPNGVGKTTLLRILLRRHTPDTGSVHIDTTRVGAIEQGGSDWMLDDSLLRCLQSTAVDFSPRAVAELLVMHKFPLALAQRPLKSLSPGERVRAALICLFQRSPAVELLVLDEPTHSLDMIGQRALTEALRVWPGGLVVVSHNKTFLSQIGVKINYKLGPINLEPVREF